MPKKKKIASRKTGKRSGNKNKNKLRSRLAVFVYAAFIIAMGLFFLLQSNSPNTLGNSNPTVQPAANFAVNEASHSSSTSSFFDSAPQDPVYSYDVVSKSSNLSLKLGDKSTLILKIRNTGNQTWISSGSTPTYLGTSRPIDRSTAFYQLGNKGWFSGNRILMDKQTVKPGDTVDFSFQIIAPQASGIYREFFTPVIDGVKWMDDKNISWDITVTDPKNPNEKLAVTVSGQPVKYIKVVLSEQHLYAYENNEVKYNFLASTGYPGMDTPTGTYKIWNKFPVQYSPPYQLYMDNWMAITADGEYGIHSLPYWIYKDGSHVYEDADHLGEKISHGCVRVSLVNSKTLYDWADVGMPVYVVN